MPKCLKCNAIGIHWGLAGNRTILLEANNSPHVCRTFEDTNELPKTIDEAIEMFGSDYCLQAVLKTRNLA